VWLDDWDTRPAGVLDDALDVDADTGSALSMVAEPDRVIVHRPATCAGCQGALDGVAATGYERRQVVDLPPLRLAVSEHRAEEKTCPHSQHTTTGVFPADVTTTVQYGAGIKALAVYLLTYHLLPYDRTSALLGGLCGHAPAKGTLQTAVETCADGLVAVEDQIKDALRAADVRCNDETGVRVQRQAGLEKIIRCGPCRANKKQGEHGGGYRIKWP